MAVFLLGLMISGTLLIGLGIALLVRTAVRAAGRAGSIQAVALNRYLDSIVEKLTALRTDWRNISDNRGTELN